MLYIAVPKHVVCFVSAGESVRFPFVDRLDCRPNLDIHPALVRPVSDEYIPICLSYQRLRRSHGTFTLLGRHNPSLRYIMPILSAAQWIKGCPFNPQLFHSTPPTAFSIIENYPTLWGSSYFKCIQLHLSRLHPLRSPHSSHIQTFNTRYSYHPARPWRRPIGVCASTTTLHNAVIVATVEAIRRRALSGKVKLSPVRLNFVSSSSYHPNSFLICRYRQLCSYSYSYPRRRSTSL